MEEQFLFYHYSKKKYDVLRTIRNQMENKVKSYTGRPFTIDNIK